MIKRYNIENEEYFYEVFLESPLFGYIHFLKKIQIINHEEYYNWNHTISEEMLMVEHDVSKEDVFNQMKKFLVKDIEDEYVNKIIENKHFNYDNVVNQVIKGRIMEKVNLATEKIRKNFFNTLLEIINDYAWRSKSNN